jgi:hypothetical protein
MAINDHCIQDNAYKRALKRLLHEHNLIANHLKTTIPAPPQLNVYNLRPILFNASKIMHIKLIVKIFVFFFLLIVGFYTTYRWWCLTIKELIYNYDKNVYLSLKRFF